MDWTGEIATAAFAPRLGALPRQNLAAGTLLFRPGDKAEAFVVVLAGRIEVWLTTAGGREILLYAVEPGQSCVQTTLGLMGEQPYSGEARCASEVVAVLIPKPLFGEAMDRDPVFRGFVFRAFGQRMSDLTRVLERVAFGRLGPRLAAELLALGASGQVAATQAELAGRIGSAREVVSRHLSALAREGLIEVERGRISLLDVPGLRRLAAGRG